MRAGVLSVMDEASYQQGAFSLSQVAGYTSSTSSGHLRFNCLLFNASWSNGIYGSGSKVQAPALQAMTGIRYM